ncbi:MAG: Asp-tRNA(Asn)/Glu-tRNA(Gln) amidotransferase subunit GatC [Deltaproteobacteria bacterium]|jgi:aspartyl-tRNA(Asn)/glutamyl-tRNA(Gln) amidotransferase subunit C|nr:Asp-tRNA(Asn)/Glu-tRNA(Gln) amidotransferase subunit GatC [Deltaproteobacteria bacterium]
MPISKESILRISRLARLDLEAGTKFGASENQVEAFVEQMQRIVGYIDILEEADTVGVEPLYSPLQLTAQSRPDVIVQEYTREEILRNAPEQADGFFVVPKVI